MDNRLKRDLVKFFKKMNKNNLSLFKEDKSKLKDIEKIEDEEALIQEGLKQCQFVLKHFSEKKDINLQEKEKEEKLKLELKEKENELKKKDLEIKKEIPKEIPKEMIKEIKKEEPKEKKEEQLKNEIKELKGLATKEGKKVLKID